MTKKTNHRGMANKGVATNANVAKQESNNNLSAIGSRHAPKNVFSFNKRARRPSIRSVKHANIKRKNAYPHHPATIALIIRGTSSIRMNVTSVARVIRLSDSGKCFKICNVNF